MVGGKSDTMWGWGGFNSFLNSNERSEIWLEWLRLCHIVFARSGIGAKFDLMHPYVRLRLMHPCVTLK